MPTKPNTARDRSARQPARSTGTSSRRQTSSSNSPGARQRDSGNPGGGAGRREQVGRSGVYPASGPLPPDNAPYQGMGSFGQGKRGAAGYEDSGRSEPSTYAGKKDLYGTATSQDRVRAVKPKGTRGTTRNAGQTRRGNKSRQAKKGR